MKASILAMLLSIGGIANLSAQAQDQATAARDKAECQAANRGRDGRVNVNGYIKCRDDRDRIYQRDAANRQAERKRLESESKSLIGMQAERQSDALAATLTPALYEQQKSECEVANRNTEGRLNNDGYFACMRTAEIAAIDRARDDQKQLSQKRDDEAVAAKSKQELAAAEILAKFAREKAAEESAFEAAQLEERRAEERLQKKCGRDYMRVAVGMSWSRVRECAGPFSAAAGSEGATLYRNQWIMLAVANGKVIRWVAIQ